MIKDQFDLTDKCGIVTGASRGLGRGMADGLAGMGANLVITARNMDILEKTASDASSYVTGTTLYIDGGFLSM